QSELGTIDWQFKLKDRASVGGRRDPNSTAVVFNDRTADEKPHAHSIRSGREQWLEDQIQVGWINSCSCILNRHTDHAGCGLIGLYLQDARPNRKHGLDAVHNQVQDNLLQLHLVALHRREVFVEVRLEFYAVLLELETHDRQNRQDDLVDVDR